jgi:hypothetical protein
MTHPVPIPSMVAGYRAGDGERDVFAAAESLHVLSLRNFNPIGADRRCGPNCSCGGQRTPSAARVSDRQVRAFEAGRRPGDTAGRVWLAIERA